jgi:hypothetical protein
VCGLQGFDDNRAVLQVVHKVLMVLMTITILSAVHKVLMTTVTVQSVVYKVLVEKKETVP